MQKTRQRNFRDGTLDVDPDGQDDGHNPFPAELLLDSEGSFIVQEPMENARLPEDGLAGEDR